MDPFVHLHVHSSWSFLDGYGMPAQFVERAKELGQTALAVTDHGNVSAHKKWNDACLKEGVKPLLGLEAYVTDNADDKKDRRRWHITLLAKDLDGYHNLLKLVTLSWDHEHFYYKPRVDWAMLKECSKGIVATSACPSGRIGRGVTQEGWSAKRVEQELKRQAEIFGDYYVEVSPWAYDEGIALGRTMWQAARGLGLPLVLTMDAHYPKPEHAHIQDVMLCIQNKVKFNDPNRMKFSQQDFCIWSGDDMAAKWQELHKTQAPLLDEMLANTRKIADSVDLKFPSATPLKFKFEGDKVALLRELCEQGMEAKGLNGKPKYRERLEYEFQQVVSKDFVDYFLVVSDLIRWAKRQDILVGAARGSSCGSLMCWLTRITEIDPLKFDLLFERFIDVSRSDPPDIDCDFESERRHEVKEYLEATYGKDKVANMPTFSTFKGKICLQDIGRVFSDKIPQQAVDEVKRLVVTRSSADSRAGFTIEDTFTSFEQAAGHLKKYPELGLAKEMEGQIRQLGVHAAGVVISNEPIGNFAATYTTGNGDRVMSLDYNDASSIGLLKIDILGLTALTAMKRCINLVKERHGQAIDLLALPLDDGEVYKAFRRGELRGIFQFEGLSTQQICRQMQPENFDQLTAVNALSRPGPLQAGGTQAYIDRRHGRAPATPLHPMLEHITRNTYGITVYQEQVMFAVRHMGKFDWKQTSAIRKAMSKKFGNEFFDKMRKLFVEGATSQGVTEEDALRVWKNINTFGAWAFNLSHSVAYTTMAYQLMWLKVHYPNEFYACVVEMEADIDKQRATLREFKASGGKILPVCINASPVGTIGCENGSLRLGLSAVVGLTEKAKQHVAAARPFASYVDFTNRCKASEKQSELLLKVGAFRDTKTTHLAAQLDMFGAQDAVRQDFDYRQPKDSDIAELCPLAVDDRLMEKRRKWLAKLIGEHVWTVQEINGLEDRTEVVLIGNTDPNEYNFKNKVEECRSKSKEFKRGKGEEGWPDSKYDFLNFDLDDGTGSIIVRIGYKIYPALKEQMWTTKPEEVLAVRGMCNGGIMMVFASQVINLTQMAARLKAKEPVTRDEQKFLQPPERREWRTNKDGNL